MALDIIKIGIRQNLIYPFFFMLSINLLRTIRVIIQEVTQNLKINSIFSLLTFVSNIIYSIVFIYLESKIVRASKSRNIIGIKLIQNEPDDEVVRIDSDRKIIILIVFDAFFEFLNTIRKEFLLALKPPQTKALTLDIRIRSREILFAALICYFTIGTQLNLHHKVSLLIIFCCIISLYIFEVTHQFQNNYYENFLAFIELQALKVFINIARVFSDVIEKYLFVQNNISPFKILFLKSTIGLILMIIFTIVNEPNGEIESMFNNYDKKVLCFFISLFLSIVYFAFSGFNSIYKMYTVKMYNPMTRTLSDIALDIFYFIYYSKKKESGGKSIFSLYFWANFIGQIIVVFFSFVYNEFIVLNFCGFGVNTHYQISRRASNMELYSGGNDKDVNNDNQSENSEASLNEDLNISLENIDKKIILI
jgi:hypothetical protein